MKKILLFIFSLQLVAAAALAQGVTTSSLSGSVTDTSGEALPGANVIATHEPSGTQYGTSVNPNGRFSIVNMRVGGPYKITVTFVGYQTQSFENIQLKLGEAFSLDVKMSEEGTQLGEVVVSASGDRLLNSERSGAITSIGKEELLSMPSVSRSINDMTRFTPQASSTDKGAIGGGNYRQNYITVDGSDFNNTFGIGTNLPAGGSPISLDALEEISVNVTPYDVRQSSFIGSAINAVTRSGTNAFSGSAYWYFRSDAQQGNKVRDNEPLTLQSLKENTYGFRLGGPIVKNKLFFFVNAERTNTLQPGQQSFAATDDRPFGSDPSITRPHVDELNAISNYLRQTYGYETGPYDRYDFESENTKLTARFDWNINKNHRMNIRYSQVESKAPSFPSTSTSGSGINYASSAGRRGNNALWFKNANYYQEQNFYSLALEANSLFANRFANTFRATYTNQNDPRSSDSREFPFVDILKDGTPFTSFGYEPFTYGNLRDVESFSFVDFVSWTSGIHNLLAGVQYDIQDTRNGFQRFGTGFYVFESWDDFVNGEKPINYAITYPLNEGYKQAFPKVGFRQFSAYIQDEMALSEKFRLTGGIRFELPSFPDVPEIKTHPLVAQLTFANGEKFDTGVMPDTKLMVSPRIGFNYDVKGDRSLQVRGGTGIFTGRVPTVWIVAQSGDAGLLQFTQAFSGKENTPGPFSQFKDEHLPDTPPAAGTAIPSTISAVHPDFKFPQTWKSNIAVDARLPFNFVGSLEVIYNNDLNVALGRNANLVAPQELNVPGYPDNRPIYPAANNQKFINYLDNAGQANTPGGNGALNAIYLDNTKGGHYWSVTAKLEKQFGQNFSGFVAYTQSQSKVPYDGSGDQLLNTWSLTPIVREANNPELSYASFVVPSRVVAGLTFRKEYLQHLGTSLSVFFEGSIQGRFSYTYSADFNRDGQTNDLIYVPRNASEITFVDHNYGSAQNPNIVTAEEQSEIFFRYIEQDDYLRKRKGQYAERNGAKLPWRNQVDIKFIQDIFTNIGDKRNTLQFTIDIFNFGNLLNKQWGAFDLVNASSLLVPTNVSALSPDGGVTPTFRLQTDRGKPVSETFRDNNSITSTYYMQFGLRYIFN
jgi:hypothetical protein